MTFADVIEELNRYHAQLWFRCSGLMFPPEMCPDHWSCATIVSSDGHHLAFQTGGPDEWLLAAGYKKPGSGMGCEAENEGVPVDSMFVSNALTYMVFSDCLQGSGDDDGTGN